MGSKIRPVKKPQQWFGWNGVGGHDFIGLLLSVHYLTPWSANRSLIENTDFDPVGLFF
jgi:hypothetical protein